MMRYKFLAILSVGFLIACNSTKSIDSVSAQLPLPEGLSIVQELDFFELDKFEQLYLVKGDKVFLRGKDHKLLYTYENDRYGNITTLDVSNPQKLMLFYQDFDIVVTLDNTLTETGVIDLKKFEYVDIPQVGLSNDNQIWLYDPIRFVLRKIDLQGTVLSESLPLSGQGVFPEDLSRLREDNNKVFLLDQRLGILVFDNFGQFIKIIPLTGLSDFQRLGNNIIYLERGGFFTYGIDNFGKIQLEAMDERDKERMTQIRVTGTHSYVGFAEGIRISKM